MNITLSPQQRDEPLTLARDGDSLIFNGEAIALPSLLEVENHGHPWISGDVIEENGQLQVTVILPHGANAPIETLFPDRIENPQEGVIALPPYSQGT